ncbi:MAG: hypothetical protein WAO55_02770 [Candidatus Manganitrophaceae bacterium]
MKKYCREIRSIFAFLGFWVIMGIYTEAAGAPVPIREMNITGGTFSLSAEGFSFSTPFTFIGPDTNLVGRYLGDGGGDLLRREADPNGIVGFQFQGLPVNTYSAISNMGDVNTPSNTIPGHLAPSGTVDAEVGTIEMDMRSWFANWHNIDFAQGDFASGSFDPATGGYAMSWNNVLTLNGMTFDTRWNLTGNIMPTPLPAAALFFVTGLMGIAWRRGSVSHLVNP